MRFIASKICHLLQQGNARIQQYYVSIHVIIDWPCEIMSFRGQALQRTWHLIDASNQTVGRLAGTIAPLLRGKHKPTFQPNKDCGDYVVVINAEKVS